MVKTIRRGFTIIEMIVVMAIIAVLSLMSVSGLLGINNGNATDRASEEIITAVREAQNKAVSGSVAPGGGASPLAWGVRCDEVARTCTSFYISTLGVYTTYGTEINLRSFTMTLVGSRHYFFTSPFGKYYSIMILPSNGLVTEPPAWTCCWKLNTDRPYDVLPFGTTSARTTITLTKGTSTREVVISEKGDTNVN